MSPRVTLAQASGAQVSDMLSHLDSPTTRNQKEVNVNQLPAVSLNHNLPVCPLVHRMSRLSFGTEALLSFYPSCQENTACQRTFPNFKTLLSVKRVFHTLLNWKLWPVDCTAWWYFSEASGLQWEQSQKMSSGVWHSATLALYQQTGLTWQHSFGHLMVFKWADTAHLWLAPLWHLIHQWQFVYSSTDCAVASEMLWPNCHWLLCIDLVYSWYPYKST